MSGGPVPLREFKEIYDRRLAQVYSYWNRSMQLEIAKHCGGWHPDRFDFRAYLERSVLRFHKAYDALVRKDCRTVCDVGGMWGIFPIVLRDLGLSACMTEAKTYYSRAFDPLFSFIEQQGVEILDYEPFSPDADLSQTFDGVTAMAVLEHFPHSPRLFMDNVRRLVETGGIVYLEVPNIAFWPKRLRFLLHGSSPLTPLEEIYDSEIPFIGHHHEYTLGELRALARLSSLEIVEEQQYNYSEDLFPIGKALRRPWIYLVPPLVRTTRECLAVTCRKTDADGSSSTSSGNR
jgi:SAM-dependent methyltransferase